MVVSGKSFLRPMRRMTIHGSGGPERQGENGRLQHNSGDGEGLAMRRRDPRTSVPEPIVQDFIFADAGGLQSPDGVTIAIHLDSTSRVSPWIKAGGLVYTGLYWNFLHGGAHARKVECPCFRCRGNDLLRRRRNRTDTCRVGEFGFHYDRSNHFGQL